MIIRSSTREIVAPMFQRRTDPSTPSPGVKITAMYARVPIPSSLLSSPNRLLLRRRRRLSPRMSIEFPDNFSPFVSRCARLGGRASLWQGATRRRRDTLVACAHPCDATCYETRNVTALADYLANEGFFRLLAASLSLSSSFFRSIPLRASSTLSYLFPFARVRRMQWL